MPDVWLGDDTARICLILVLGLLVVEEIGQQVHFLHEGIIQAGGPYRHDLEMGDFFVESLEGGSGGLCLVWVANCWVFSLIVVIDTTVERGICFIS